MNIGFDATAMFGIASKNRGIGNYSLSLFTTLINNDKENNYFCLNCLDGTQFAPYVENCGNFKEVLLYSGNDMEFFKYGGIEIYGDIVKTFLEKNKIDIFIITSPFDYNTASYRKEWFGNTKLYCIVYDIIPYLMKKQYLPSKPSYNKYMECVETIRFCDRIMVISESVRNDLVNHLNFNPDTIDVIMGAYDRHFKEISVPTERKSALYSKFGVHDGFIMCTGGDDYRKNIGGLISAYGKLPRKLIDSHQLVVVCKLQKESEKRYYEKATALGLTGRVVLTNFVSTEELIDFYNLAYLMAFPSKYEGFGLPVVEAWACGTPVLTSNNSSLGEIAKDAAVTVDPENIDDIAKGLEYALTKADLPALLKKGKEKLESTFNWDAVAGFTLDSLEKSFEVCRSNIALSEENEKKTKKIAMFTPVPPIKSGISDYSEDIIRELSKYFDIDVFIDDNYTPSVDFPENVSVYSHKKYPKLHNNYFDTVYQMGNSEFHVYMYPYIERFGGTLVLHDFSMNDIVSLLNARGNSHIYNKFLHADFSGDLLDHVLTYGLTSATAVNGLVVNPCHRIIVHDKYSKERLIERNFGKKVFVIPHYAKPEKTKIDCSSARKKYGFADDEIIFAAFGIIAENKRIIPLINAFAKFYQDNPNSKLLLCGGLDGLIDDEINSLISENNLKDKVKITGFLQIEDFVNYIDVCDLCFNLRYPYRGESSGSLARILAKGKPVVVNKIGSFDSVPDDACIKLPDVEDLSPDEEIRNIENIMFAFVNKKEKFKETAENGKKYAENVLELSSVAKMYRDAILSPVRFAFTKEVSMRVLNLIKEGAYTVSEKRMLAHTFAYAKDTVND